MDFFDRTGDMDKRGRGWEILGWLNKHEVESFVILDDWNDMGPVSDHLVWTKPAHGITEEQVDEAIRILNFNFKQR